MKHMFRAWLRFGTGISMVLGPMAYQGRGSGKGCTVPSYRRVSNIPSPVSYLLRELVRNISAWTHAV